MLKNLNQTKFLIKLKKCKFHQQKINFLEFKIKINETKINFNKFKSMKN